MRLLRICTDYPAYLNGFYAGRPGLDSQPFDAQYKTLMEDCFGWADYWTRALPKFGYEVWEPVGNAEHMQKAWARENGVIYTNENWLLDITEAQAVHFRPDVLLINEYRTYTAPFLKKLRERVPSIKAIIGWCGAPYADGTVFNEYDVVLSCIPSLVEHFIGQGHRSRHMHHAFARHIADKISNDATETVDFSFIGSLVRGRGFHNARHELLEKLARHTPLTVFADAAWPEWRKRRQLRVRQVAYKTLSTASKFPLLQNALRKNKKVQFFLGHPSPQRWYPSRALCRIARPPVFGMRMFQTLRSSRVSLNTHIDIAGDAASNLRLFEATGAGTCLLTDWKSNLPELFDPENEVVAYRNVDEAVEKVRYLLDNPKVCQEIARRGQARTLRDHTIEARAPFLDEVIKDVVK